MEQQLKDKVKDFTYFSLALDESSDAGDMAQLIFLQDIIPDFEITEELASVQSSSWAETRSENDFPALDYSPGGTLNVFWKLAMLWIVT